MNKSRLIGAFCATVFIFITTSSQAALISVLGGQAFYDTLQDLTWTANANINGPMNWADADTWAAGLTIGTVSDWRLPNMDVNNDNTIVNCSLGGTTQTDCKDNEYGHLWNYGSDITKTNGVTSASPGPFDNVQPYYYWSGTTYSVNAALAWTLYFPGGNNIASAKDVTVPANYAWAVYKGGAELVPVPPAVWLFGSGLLGLIGVARRQRR